MGVGLKWFPGRRGLDAGVPAAAFGSGSALIVPTIAQMIRASDYRSAFLYTGIGQGLAIVCAAQLLRNPEPGEAVFAASAAKPRVRRHHQEFTPTQMLRTPHFYVMYMTMLMMGI